MLLYLLKPKGIIHLLALTVLRRSFPSDLTQLRFFISSQTLYLLDVIFLFVLHPRQIFFWQQAVAVEERFHISSKELLI